MQEQVNDKSIQLAIKATRLTGRVLAKAMAGALAGMRRQHNKPKKGRQSLKRLERTGGGGDTSTIEIKERIRSFEAIARKNEIAYSIKKDSLSKPPTWIVTFKANKTGAVTAAFTEYSKRVLGRGKPSVLDDLRQKVKDIGGQVVDRVRNRDKVLER